MKPINYYELKPEENHFDDQRSSTIVDRRSGRNIYDTDLESCHSRAVHVEAV